jgi:hypothetical protein
MTQNRCTLALAKICLCGSILIWPLIAESASIEQIAVLRKPIDQISVRATPEGAVPKNLAEELIPNDDVISISATDAPVIGPQRYTTGMVHRPLYFEQPNLERCGNGYGCWQNKISAATFLFNTLLLPYHMGRQRCDCVVPAGPDCLACESLEIDCGLRPLSGRGLLKQAAAVAGFTFLLL